MSFGSEILRLRKQQGRSQDDVARDIGVHKKNISRWENEEVTPNVAIGAKVARSLGVSLDQLLGAPPPPDERLAALVERVMALPEKDRAVARRMLEGLLALHE